MADILAPEWGTRREPHFADINDLIALLAELKVVEPE